MESDICPHGHLRRQCETCDLRAEVERLTRERDLAIQSKVDFSATTQLLEDARRQREYYRTQMKAREKQADELMAERDRLRAALDQVEWHFGYCPFCRGAEPEVYDREVQRASYGYYPHTRGHAPDCPRQKALAASLPPAKEECVWTEDYDGCWNTGCGHAWLFEDGGPEDNGAKYCHVCGRPLRAVAYRPDED